MKKIGKCKLNGNNSFRETDSSYSNLTPKLLGNHSHLLSMQSCVSRTISWSSLISPVLFNILLVTWMKTERHIYQFDREHAFLF